MATPADLAEMQAWGVHVRRRNAGVGASRVHIARAEARMALHTAPRDARIAVAQYGARVEREFGVSRVRQLVDLWRLRTRYGMKAASYYSFQLYRAERRARWGAYMHPAGTGNVLRHLFRLSPSDERTALMDDKAYFARWCVAHGFPVVGTLTSVDAHGCALPAEAWPAVDLFTKPVLACRGHGARRWRALGPGRYVEDAGTGRAAAPVDAAGLALALRQQAAEAGGPVLVQPLIRNHAEVLSLTRGGLATVRLVTYRLPDAPAGAIAGIFRMPRGDTPVDNFAVGGLAAPFDLASGVLGVAVTKTIDDAGRTYAVHPDTGGTIAGRELPDWQAIVQLGLTGHDAMAAGGAPALVVGWDIAVTDRGPVLVELNTIPCVTGTQMTTQVPLGATPYVPALLAHLRHATCAAR